MSDKNCVLIFDGTNTFIRNFVINPTSDINGTPIGGLVGTIRSIKWMIADVKPTHVIFVWDGKGGSQRRRGVVAEYKMGRKPRLNREVDEGVKDSAQNMGFQMEKLKALLPFLGVTQIEIDNIEADDTIGYLVGMLGETRKVVVSSDRDMWQFVSPTTTVYWPTKKVYISSENMSEYVPVLPENYVLFRAMSGKGDASDNIHGIKGLGDKTIQKLFPFFDSIPVDFSYLKKYMTDRLELHNKGEVDLTASEKRWYKVILDNEDLVKRNVEVMQLTSPEISASAASIIRNLAIKRPSFNMTGFKIALLNNNIQLTDNDMFGAFQEYKMRSENAAA